MATSTLGSGTLVLAGTTSGTTTVTATAVAGTTTLTLPAATDTLVGKATTDTLTNKTLGAVTLGGTVAGGGNQINNVIIGTTSPLAGAFTTIEASTSVRSGTTGASLLIKPVSATPSDGVEIINTFFTGSQGPLLFKDGTTTRMTLDASGRLGIGTTTPANVLDVSGASGSLARFKSTGNYSTVIADNTSTTGGGAFAVYKQGAQIGIFGVSGAVLGDTSADIAMFAETGSSLKFYTNGSGTVKMTIGTGGTVTMSAYGAGTATFSAAGVISSVSDETWKIKDGVPTDPDSMLKKLEPGYWFYNDEKKETFGADRQLGFYAQNVNAAIGPEAAPTPEEGKPWGYYDRSVLAVTVMSLQKALATIETLTARITALESA